MIRKVLSGLVLVGAVVVSLSQAQAATEVMETASFMFFIYP